LDAIAFGGDVDVSRGMYSPRLLDVAHVVTARIDEKIVGVATGVPAGGAVAVFGVAVAPEARRRGIGAALTRAAARAGDAGTAWLSARGEAARVYERLGFREVGRTEIWVG
jgi:ribosomal protein S18 acetylase RimI-like enzyme